MLERISINKVNISNKPKNQPNFKGDIGGAVLSAATSAIQICESNPMVNVAVLDLATAIVPRTVIEGQTNPYAGLEAFRRESSGLIINCMIPGVIVAGIAKLISSGIMGGKTEMSNCWANEDTIKLVTKYWKEAEGKDNVEKAEDTIRNILKDTKAVDGKEMVDFSKFKFENSVKTFANSAFNNVDKKEKKQALADIIEKTRAAEHIKIGDAKDYHSQSLGEVLENAPKIIKELTNGRNVDDFARRAKTLVTAKSLGGLALILPLAIAAQPINRWITEKTSGKKGAPIYKDFTESENKELSSKEKAALFKQKLISVSAMVGVAMLSIMKKPSMEMLKSITQFKGIFPSMDQARIISTATFASRMMASQDKNDLREATVRDIATFSAFYFLGDYVAKGIANGLQKATKIQLINDLSPLKGNETIWKKIKHWTKDTAMKSSAELAEGKPKQMRALCQIGNIAFSLVALGLLIPKLNRKKTDKEREKELKEMGLDKKTIDKYYPHFMNSPNFASKGDTYKAFFTAK